MLYMLITANENLAREHTTVILVGLGDNLLSLFLGKSSNFLWNAVRKGAMIWPHKETNQQLN